MARDDNPKASSPETTPATKAQVEFQRYKAGPGASQAQAGTAGNQVFMHPINFPQNGPALPHWAFPPSMAALPQPLVSAGLYPSMMQPGIVATGSLQERLGSTLRLSIDVVNAALAGGVRVLGGISNMAYRLGDEGMEQAGYGSCGSWCDDGCVTRYNYHDCCGCSACGNHCHPSVGTCC